MRVFIYAIVLSLAMVSCKSAVEVKLIDNGPLQMNASSVDGANSAVFPVGDAIGFYMNQTDLMGGDVSAYRENIVGVSESGGGLLFTPKVPYPIEKKLNIYGYYPHNETGAVNGVFELATVADQSVDGGMKLMDFMAAFQLSVTSSKNKVMLPFQHKFTMISISLVKGTGVYDWSTLSGATVSIEKIPSKSHFNFVDNTIKADYTELVSLKPYGVFVLNETETAMGGVSAILPTRSANEPAYLVKVTINKIIYAMEIKDALVSGTAYDYTIAVTRSGVVPALSITPWAQGATAEYPAVLWATSRLKFVLDSNVDKVLGDQVELTTTNAEGNKSRISNLEKSEDAYVLVTPLEQSVIKSAKFFDTKTQTEFSVSFNDLFISNETQSITITNAMIN